MRTSLEQNHAGRTGNGLKHEVELRLVKLLNIVLIAAFFACSWFFYYAHRLPMSPSLFRSGGIITLFIVIYYLFCRIYDAFHISVKHVSDLFLSQLLSIIIADAFLFVVIWLMSGGLPNCLPILLALVGQLLFSLIWCKYANSWYFSRFAGLKTAIVYEERRGIEDILSSYDLCKRFDVLASSSMSECLEGGMAMLNGVEVVFICGERSHERNQILKHCTKQGICVYVIPCIEDVIMSGGKRTPLFHMPMVRVERYNPSLEFLFFKRLFDIVSSALVILVTSPLMLACAIAVKVQDGGPVFYRQSRLTKDGREFTMIKFRSMRTDAEKDGVARLSTGKNDDRITPVGRFLRASRLDELPQLFNILEGSMSVVGPRPERPEIASQYEQDLPEFNLRLQAKAGLTGYAQVYGKYNTSPYDKLQMDLMYIANPSFIEDLKIIFATIKILFSADSTEGVKQGCTTAMGQVFPETTKNDVKECTTAIVQICPETIENANLSKKGSILYQVMMHQHLK